MALSNNPILTEDKFKPAVTDQAGWAAAGYGAGASTGTRSAVDAPSGSTMTIGGTITATAVLWILLLASGAYAWSQVAVSSTTVETTTGPQVTYAADVPGWFWVAGIFGFVLAIVISFKPTMARFLSPVYALAYGLLLGAISKVYELQFDGIVLQAVGATMAVFGAMMFLYATRIIKVTKRYAMIVMGAMLGIFAMYLVAFVASFFGADLAFYNDPTPLGIGISVVIAIVAAMSLALDFAFIENASKSGFPKYMEWYGAFGITVTIVWLYLTLLRLLSLLRQ